MPAIIGGSSSTGSSLLVNMLNRHTEIYAGPETHLFTKPQLYKNWETTKQSLLSKQGDSLKSPGIHRYNGVILNDEFSLGTMIMNANSLTKFADAYFRSFGKRDWVEKTPANVYSFDMFLKVSKEHKVIRIVRNPYDVVASLLKRNIPLDKAAALYICNNLMNMNLKDNDGYLSVKYEDLVSKPKEEVSKITDYLGYEFEEQMLDAEDETVMMEGWLQNEKGTIGTLSVGRFSRLGEEEQAAIITVLSKMKLKSEFMDPYRTSIDSVEAICELYDFEYLRNPKLKAVYSNSWSDRLISTIKLYPTHLFNYPVTIE